ncbi:MAG: DNA primase [Nitrospinae bacterium]|nr:DNA primase [Nitrospinota bacterium]
MAGLFPREVIDQVRDAVDVVELISSYVHLKKSGANFVGLCPFHAEKSPSFTVSPSKQFYHCFGCGEGGNAISFVMKRESLGFVEAVEFLANRAGITLPKRHEEPKEYSRIYEINKLAADFFRSKLADSPAAAYASRRGLSPETLQKFRIGYAPDAWDSCLGHLLSKKVGESEVENAGLAKKSSAGNLIDRFRNRMMFPISDERERVVGFGGRTLAEDDKGPKYLNSPETPVYFKGRVLYGLDRAGQAVRKKDQVMIVEGYMDLVALHQAGVENAVATSGTAFTEGQCRLLRRYTSNFVMVFDGDEAGKKAAARATEAAAAQGIRPSVVMLPTGKDPDDVVREGGAKAFLEMVRDAKPYMTYLIDQACAKHDMTTGEGRADAARSVLPELAALRDPLERASCVGYLSQKTGISAEKIEARLRTPRSAPDGGRAAPRPGVPVKTTTVRPRPPKPATMQEKKIMRGILDHPEKVTGEWGALTADDFLTPGFGVMLEHVRTCIEGGTTSAGEVIETLENQELRAYARALVMEDAKPESVAFIGTLVTGLHAAGLARRRKAERKKEIEEKKNDAERLK